MLFHFSILARTEDPTVKIIFGVIFFVIWAISAAVSAMAKKQQELKRRQMSGQAPPTYTPPPTAPAPPNPFGGTTARAPRQTAPARPSAKPQQRSGKPPKVKAQARRPVAAPPPPLPITPERSAMQAPPTPTTHLAGGSAGSTTVIGGNRAVANPLLKLMNPKTLRTLVITNELLQPPVAMREQWPPHG